MAGLPTLWSPSWDMSNQRLDKPHSGMQKGELCPEQAVRQGRRSWKRKRRRRGEEDKGLRVRWGQGLLS